jgi:ligand-binding sensor domain-containing protein
MGFPGGGEAVRRMEQTYPIQEVGRSRGLPTTQVHDLAVGDDGTMWFAGPSGLARYDGSRIESFGKKDGLSTNGLRALAVAANGVLGRE